MFFFYKLLFLLFFSNNAISEPIQVKGKLQYDGLYSLGKAYQIDTNAKYLKNKIYVKFKDNSDYSLLLKSFIKRNNTSKISFPFQNTPWSPLTKRGKSNSPVLQEGQKYNSPSSQEGVGGCSEMYHNRKTTCSIHSSLDAESKSVKQKFDSLQIPDFQAVYKLNRTPLSPLLGRGETRKSPSSQEGQKYNSPVLQEGQKYNSPSLQEGVGGSSENLLQNIALIDFKQNVDIPALCAELNKYDEVEYAVPQYIHEFRFTPNDTEYSKQYYLQLINMEQAWEISKGSSDVVIAIVDSGTDILHDDLKGNIWNNPNEIPDNNIDDDENGYIDDVSGWDFIGDLSQVEVNQSLWKEDNNVIPNHSSNEHGTHVAGIAASVTNNSLGIASPAFNCKILPVKVATDNLDPNSNGTSATLRGYEGILYAAQMGADIINVSWGAYSYSPLEEDLIKQAQAYGALIVAAVGNDEKILKIGTNDYPAMYPGVISVGATNTNGGKANYSNSGIPVDVFAPGNSVLSTLPNNRYGNQTGCSMASPLVASVAALVKSHNPDIDNATLAQQIRSSSNMFSAETRPKNFYGVLNAENALKYNDPNYPDLEVPGISVSKVNTTYKYGFINNYDENIFKITFKNYLADARNIQIKISNYENELEESKIYSLNELKNKSEATFDYEFKLRSDFPWYYDKLQLDVEIIADDYQNYELIELVLLMPTFNKFRVPQEFIDFEIGWFDSHSPNYNEFFAVGYDYNQKQPVMLSYQNKYTDFRSIAPFEATSIFVDKNDIAYLTTKSGMLLKTANRGESFTVAYDSFYNPKDVYIWEDDIFVVDLNEEDNTLIYKENSSGFDTLKGINSNIVKVDFYKNYITTINTDPIIEVTKDFGKSWSLFELPQEYSKMTVFDIEFINDSLLAVAYRKFFDDFELGIFDIVNNEIIATYNILATHLANEITKLYSPIDSEELFLVYKDLTVKKLTSGKIEQELSFNHHQIFTADGVSECGSTQIWQMGKDLAYLEMDYLPNDIEREIDVISKKVITFDTTDVGMEDSDFVMLENSGNVRAIIESIEIIGDDAFYISSDEPYSVPSCNFASFFVNFKPATYGEFSADLIIKTNSDPHELVIELIGNGYDPTSVEDIITGEEILIYPNPANDFIYIKCNDLSLNSEISIFNSLGQKMLNYEVNPGEQKIDISSLQRGMYVIKISANNRTEFYKFVKL